MTQMFVLLLFSSIKLYENFFIDLEGDLTPFMGVGGISGGGATSKYLLNYSNSEDIMKLLFESGRGINLEYLKVEIGGDCESSCGSEASHMHTEDDENYNRGYEWELMKTAKRLNPNVKLSALAWCFPGWIGLTYLDSVKLATYIVKWVKNAQSVHNLTMDSIGIVNEQMYNKEYIKILRQLLNDSGFSATKIIVADGISLINIDMAHDKELLSLVDIVGVHYPNESVPYNSLGKPMISSEDNAGGGFVNRFNRNFIKRGLTGFFLWNIVNSYLPQLPFYGTGLIFASEPWSGNYGIATIFFEFAHLTRFTQSGWSFVDGSSRVLENNGSVVVMRSPDGEDFLILVETTYVDLPFTMNFVGDFENKSLFVRKTILNSDSDYFIRNGTILTTHGYFSFTFGNNSVYSFSTEDTDDIVIPTIPSPGGFPQVYKEDFESLPVNSEAPYLAQQVGSFEVNMEPGNLFYRQMVTKRPMFWTPVPHNSPYVVLPSSPNATFVEISSNVRIQSLVDVMPFLALRTNSGGLFSYLSEGLFFFYDQVRDKAVISEDIQRLLPIRVVPNAYGTKIENSWFRMTLIIDGDNVMAMINDKVVFDVKMTVKYSNFDGFGLSTYAIVDFDDFELSSRI